MSQRYASFLIHNKSDMTAATIMPTSNADFNVWQGAADDELAVDVGPLDLVDVGLLDVVNEIDEVDDVCEVVGVADVVVPDEAVLLAEVLGVDEAGFAGVDDE